MTLGLDIIGHLFQVALGQAAQVVEALDELGLKSNLAPLFRDLICIDTIVVEVFADAHSVIAEDSLEVKVFNKQLASMAYPSPVHSGLLKLMLGMSVFHILCVLLSYHDID